MLYNCVIEYVKRAHFVIHYKQIKFSKYYKCTHFPIFQMTATLGLEGQIFKLQSTLESSQKAEHGNKQNRKMIFVTKLAIIEYEKIFSYSITCIII